MADSAKLCGNKIVKQPKNTDSPTHSQAMRRLICSNFRKTLYTMQAVASWSIGSYTKTVMLMMSKGLFGQPILSLHTEGQIGVAQEPIINPHNLKIIGWWCKSPSSPKQLVLLADNVREMMPKGLAVDNDSALSAPEDLVRHREILDIHFVLLDKLVRTKRHKLGKVSDFTYDESMFVQKLYVARSLVKIFSPEDTLIIDRSQIQEVTDNYILVDDNEAKETQDEMAGATAIAAS